MNKSRKFYQVNKAGNLGRLQQAEGDVITPDEHEVVIKVRAIGLNFADIFAILGLYSATPKGSFIPGLEYSGEIESLGNKVTGFVPGDRVMGVTRFGGYASHITINQAYIRPLPDGWTYEEGAAYLVQGLTAYYGLFTLGRLQKGETLVIHSAAGGVGLLANRMAQRAGAYTIGTVGNTGKLDLLQREGYQKGLVRSRNFGRELDKMLDGRPLDLVMECIGGSIFRACYERLAPRGRMIVYGSARYGDTSRSPNWLRLAWLYLRRPKIDPQKMIETNRSVHGFNLIWLYDQKHLMQEILENMRQLDLPPPYVGHQYSFENLPEAIKLFQSGKTTGKVVVTL